MGGEGSGRLTRTEQMLRAVTAPKPSNVVASPNPVVLPNLSGVQSAAIKGLSTGIAFKTDHVAENTSGHGVVIDSGMSLSSSAVTTYDNSSADTAYIPMVLYNTDATPPAASGFPIGTLYVQYTA